jgi:hypothetical protein
MVQKDMNPYIGIVSYFSNRRKVNLSRLFTPEYDIMKEDKNCSRIEIIFSEKV